jgi:hypothetical protein
MQGRASLWTCVRSRNVRSLIQLVLSFLLTSGTERCKTNRATRKPWRAERCDAYRMSEGARRERGSRSSPLHWFVIQKPRRKRPAHFPTVAVEFQSIIIFLTVCTRERPLLANDGAAPNRGIMGSRKLLACRSVRHHAGARSFVLCPEHLSGAPAEEMDRILAKPCDATLAESCSASGLATRVLGPAVEALRIIRREVAICCEQSGSSRLCASRGRLALSRRTQCAGMARRIRD